jgi:4-amino-4-deoxy-L-arabinose transferase-like glycosyltransferase
MQADQLKNETENKWLYGFIGLAVLVNFSGLFVPLMDPDAGVYASVTKNMVLHNDYLSLWFQDKDWLDKPHFPFWITAVFFKVFGIHDWSYKLPGVLFVMFGAYYTYLFTKQHYNKTIALWSVFILLTASHIIVSNNDVRAEPFLTGLIIAAVYHFSNSFSKNISWHLAAACLFTACAVMTKGVFTLIPIGGAIIGELIFKQNWKQIFHWRWIVALFLLIIFISPELYSLWYQFDAHPEKIIFDKQNVSGIKFFLWDSQFGRFFNTGPIKGKGDPTFFLHTLLWAFLPWCIIMYTAFYSKCKDAIKKVKPLYNEWYTISGSLLALFVFSFSGFQLPYYANIIFPLLAIICANFIWQQLQSGKNTFSIIQFAITVIVISLGAALFIFYKPEINLFYIILIALLLFLVLFLKAIIGSGKLSTPYLQSGLAVLIVTLFLNLIFYPDLLKYQSGNEVAFYINKNDPGIPIARINIYFPSGEFYLNQYTNITSIDAINKGAFIKGSMLFVTEAELGQLKETKVTFEVLKEFPHFHITMLTLKFINPKTRESQLEKRFLVKLL